MADIFFAGDGGGNDGRSVFGKQFNHLSNISNEVIELPQLLFDKLNDCCLLIFGW
jgi:hypothetical protein